ncbi:MAG: bile acid:sodium symporter [Desulfobacteraceae bacterium]|nr:bile acid:sodium symporter [Desulfobacteraceae bacterium]
MQKIRQHWFLFSLVLVVAAVIFERSNYLVRIGLALKDNYGPEIMICLIFFISGLLIQSHQIKAGIKDIKSTLLSLAVIVVFAPMAAVMFCVLPLETGVAIGLFIVAAMPTTLSSGVVMTQTAGGNMAHALFVTILSNFIGIFSIPIVLSWLLSFLNQEKELMIDQGAIIIKLTLLVLFPLLIGIGAKSLVFKANRLNKFKMQIINQWLIIGVVFISLAGAKQIILGNGIAFVYILILVSAFHIVLLSFSFALVKIFSIKKGRFESIIFMGSQKTLPLSVMIQISYFNEFGTALLVCVLHHIVHLMIDGYLSTKMGKENLD